ncbi:MAG TPA: AAA family ATPase, partial [Lacipirellulaceae bacterium]|nr:AAA family ATPase [Lacipirellulaceae bacterium]
MLSALELNGFKSFAEAGITVVVGPNGSGKSNVVDAIKWVLGSQSAKSLRGKEMSDVIFSGSKSRRQAGAAEVSLFLDNANGAIDHDAQQLQITRRVFRSGESEYLINRQPCRLRDVRDLLAAAGIATSGYAIIEQGRVDAVLQSSPKERRLIFEEAAGISRFRLKREEAARRLERVQQNLRRLGDVVEELQTRLKTVRAQATRARRYSETTERVRSLRIELGLEDWRTITARLDALQSDLAAELAIEQSLASQAAEAKAALVAIDERSELLARQLRETLSADATVRERLAQAESTRSSHLVRIDELEQEVVRLSHQLQTLASRAGDSQQLVATTADDLVASERLRAQLHQQVDALQQQMEGDETAAAEMRRETTRARDAVQEAERQVQQFGVERHSSEAKLHAVDVQREQRDSERQPLAERRERLAVDLRRATAELTRITAEVDESAGRLEAVHSELALHRAQLSAAQKRQAELAGRLTGARERIVVLEELEARLDGLAAGAREALRRARDEPDGPFRSVRGVVADLLQVDADTAPMIEAALGERANYLVVTETKSLAPVLADPQAWPARTTFLRLDVPHQASAVDRVELSNEPGVMGRADRFVEAPEDLSPLVRRLLARYWLVDTFTTAARLAAGLGQGLNFVTVAGEVMLADGTLAVGPRPSVGGMLSRRSELRALRDEIESMQTALADAEADSRRLEGLIDRGELATRQQTAAHANLVRVQAEVRVQSKAIAEHLEQIDVRLESLVAELETLDAQRGRLEHERDAAAASQQAAAEAVERRRSEIGELETCLAETTQRLAESQGKLNESRIELARAEQRVEGLRRQMEQLAR